MPRLDLGVEAFFEEVTAGADAYILKRILHDWNDDELLQNFTKPYALL